MTGSPPPPPSSASNPIVTRLQWSALAKVTALAGLGPGQVTQAVIDQGRQALTAAIGRHRPASHGPKALSAALFGLQTTLFHLGVLGTAPRKTSPDRSAERAAQWASAPPQLASTLAGDIAQVRLSLRASTMVRVEGVLREFACWLAGNAPEVACVAGLRRRHIENYKLHLASPPLARGGKLSKISLAEHLGALRTCFERLTEWDGGDVPPPCWCSPATCRCATSRCPASLTTAHSPSCCRPPAPTPTRSSAWP